VIVLPGGTVAQPFGSWIFLASLFGRFDPDLFRVALGSVGQPYRHFFGHTKIDGRNILQFAMKIATYNVNSIRIRLDAIIAWLEKHQPDVLCIQETKCQDDVFPVLVLRSTGYQVHYRGMKSYNGVAVLTRVEPDDVFYGFDDQLPDIDDARLMRVVVGGIPIINTYVPNGYKVGTLQHEYKLKWYARLKSYFAQHLTPDKPALWCGDMNVAPEPIDVHSPEKHLRHVCFHETVRNAYKDTVSWGFFDVYRRLYPDKQQFTFWDYLRPSSLDNNKGWRLDHILATGTLAEKCRKVDVDIEPRRALRASDHTFVWAEFED
jgi:exodeoxyribonuclease III